MSVRKTNAVVLFAELLGKYLHFINSLPENVVFKHVWHLERHVHMLWDTFEIFCCGSVTLCHTKSLHQSFCLKPGWTVCAERIRLTWHSHSRCQFSIRKRLEIKSVGQLYWHRLCRPHNIRGSFCHPMWLFKPNGQLLAFRLPEGAVWKSCKLFKDERIGRIRTLFFISLRGSLQQDFYDLFWGCGTFITYKPFSSRMQASQSYNDVSIALCLKVLWSLKISRPVPT